MKKTLIALFIAGALLVTACNDKQVQSLQQELSQTQQNLAQLKAELEKSKQQVPSLQTETLQVFSKQENIKLTSESAKEMDMEESNISVAAKAIKTNVEWLDNALMQHLYQSVGQTSKLQPTGDALKDSQAALEAMYHDFVEMLKETPANAMDFELAMSYQGQRHNILTFSQYQYSYTGGAHGLGFTEYLVFDANKQKQIKIQDLFSAKNMKKAAEILWKQYVEERGGKEDEVFTDKANFLENLNNFYFSEEGVVFSFVPYAIASYAEGEPKLTLYWGYANNFINPEYQRADMPTFEIPIDELVNDANDYAETFNIDPKAVRKADAPMDCTKDEFFELKWGLCVKISDEIKNPQK